MSSALDALATGSLADTLESSDGFQLLVRTIPDAVLAVDASGTVRYASELSRSYLGRSVEDIVGSPFLELFQESDRGVFPLDLGHDAIGAWDVRPATDPEVWLNVAILVPDVLEESSGLRRALDGVTLFLVRDVPRSPDMLRDRTDLLRRALDSANNIIVVSDPQAEDNPLVFANEYFFEVTGYTRAEVIGRNCRFLQVRGDGTRDDDQEGVRELRRAIKANEPAHVILRNYRKSGELFYNELFVTPIRNAAGTVVNFVGVQNDVTERITAQHDAASQSGLLRAFYDSAPVLMGVVQRDDAGIVHRTANQRATKLFEVDADAVAGARSQELGFTPAEAERWERAVAECAEAGEPVTFETTVPWDSSADADGTRSLNVTVSRVHIPGGLQQEELFSYIGEDVTEARRSAARIRTLAAAVEGTAEAILITDASDDPKIVYVNPSHEVLTGYSSAEVLGRSPRMFQGPRTERATLDRIRRRLEAGEAVAAETVNYRKDGTEYVLQWEISPVRDAQGEVTKWVSLQRDVTQQRQLEYEVLEAAGREQEWMAREIHDGLGQVLTGSGIQLHVLTTELEKRGEVALATDARRIGQHIAEALEQARTISRGLFPITVEPGELVPALEHLCDEAGQSLGIEIDYHAQGTFLVASAERAGHLYRIVQEALTNAARHGGARRVEVALSQDGAEGRLLVRDDGSGISDQALESGGGLGLRTMAYRARRVGGSLDVGRHDDGGTAVRVRFALITQRQAEPGEGE